jgi:hypothetical protein
VAAGGSGDSGKNVSVVAGNAGAAVSPP